MLVTSDFPFPTIFSTLPKPNFNFSFICILLSANAFNLDQSAILSFGKELSNTTAQNKFHPYPEIVIFYRNLEKVQALNTENLLEDDEVNSTIQQSLQLVQVESICR